MLTSLKISGFKNFRGKSVELKELKRINLLVGINGSGKTSVLEALALSSRFDVVNPGVIPVKSSNFLELNSLIGTQTTITMGFDDANCSYTIKGGKRNIGWDFEKDGSPEGIMEVVAIWKSKHFFIEEDRSHPFTKIREIDMDNLDKQDLGSAQEFLKTVNPEQRLYKTVDVRGEDVHQEDQGEISLQKLAGGTQYLAMLLKAIRLMHSDKRPASIILVDDLGDSIFPSLRKALVPKLNEELTKHPEAHRAQMFATTHNIEIVKSALEHPEYCGVYIFTYDGSLAEFDNLKVKKTESSSGLTSVQEIPIIANMLGLTDLDLGFPEIVIFSEEETKKTFLTAIQENPHFSTNLKKYEVKIPFQTGDGNVSTAINNLLDLSKYFSFSEIWSDRYSIFTDYNTQDYDENGNVKEADKKHIKALKRAQEKLVLGDNFLLTKKEDQFVTSIEETYPDSMWEDFKNQKSITADSIKDWVSSKRGGNKGKAKSELAEFIGANITLEIFNNSYPELAKLIIR